MSGDALIFERIRVDRVPGVRRGEGFTIDSNDLSPGINIVHGPNGSGKSTTARVIHELIWPGQTGVVRASVAADFQWRSSRWHVEVDSGHPVWWRDGQAAERPDAGPPETRHRYRLALHELIHDDNAAFAKAVADATQGGFDLDRAAKALGFLQVPKTHRAQRNDVDSAGRHLHAARDRQRKIEDDARQLDDLERQRREAVAAGQHVERLNRALEHREAVDASEGIRQQLAAHAPQMAELTGREQQQLDEIIDRRNHLNRHRQELLEQVASASRQQARTNLPESGAAETSLRDLSAACGRLTDLQRQIDDLKRQVADSGAQAGSALRRIGPHLSEAQLRQLQRVEIGELSDLARLAEHLRAEKRVMQERDAWLSAQDKTHPMGAAGDPQKLHQGLTALGQWLVAPSAVAAQTSRAWWLLAAAGGFGLVLVLLLGAVHHPAWLVLVPVGPALAWMGVTRSEGGQDARQVHRRTYERTGLNPPAAWRPDAVAECAQALADALSKVTLADHRRQLRYSAAPHSRELEQRVASFERQRKELRQQLGIAIDFEIGDQWLAVLADNISTWQQHATRAEGAAAPLQNAESQVANILDSVNRTIAPFGYGAVDGAHGATQAMEDLSCRRDRFVEAASRIDHACETMSRSIEPDLVAIEQDHTALFERLDLDVGDDRTLRDWLERYGEYAKLVKQQADCEAVRRNAAAALTDEPELLQADRVELERLIADDRRLAGRRDELAEQIASIRNHIDEAKRGHDMTEALARRLQCFERMSDLREQDCNSVVGKLLVDHVRRVCTGRNRPQVFKRSNALLAAITHGSLQLDFDDRSAPPAFMARDESDQARPLYELSTGERVQLLMAVRLGFVEAEESASRLPLLMDETLGTSDDRRTAAIIDTVIEVARAGRQVFYFTAQNDEVGKWVGRLREAQVPFQTVDLAVLRSGGRREVSPLSIAPVETQPVLAPNGLTYEQYGGRLGVPGLDPAAGSTGRVHLWHLLNDSDVLYDLLQRGVTTWGQLRTLLDAGGGALVNSGGAAITLAEVAARGVEAACNAWRIGRGKPVDRAVLLESGCVTDRFIDRVTELAERFGGDAGNLLSALDGPDRPARWPGKSTQKLRDYLEAAGFIDSQTQLPREQIRLRVVGALAEDLRNGRIDQEWIDRMVGLLPE